jgi:polar amino acid transport system permease protein
MNHDFSIVWSERGLLAAGLANTIVLSILATLMALLFGSLVCLALVAKRAWIAVAAHSFVDAMRCTPFLLFAYIVYYGLPSFGINFDNWSAGLAALAVYNTAYMAELLRAAWAAQPVEPMQAGFAYGFYGPLYFRRIVLPQLIMTAAPMVGNQVIQVIKDSAFLTVIALPELTHAASSIQSRHFIPFAAFISAVLIYWALCLLVEGGVSAFGRYAEQRR